MTIRDNVKLVIGTSLEKLLSVKTKIIHSRLIMFIGLYLDELFKNDNDKLITCVKFLFMHLFGFNTNQGLSFQVKL